jgi:hypothetical protein
MNNKSGRRRRATRRGSCTSPPTGWSGSRPSPRRRCSCFGASAGPSPCPTPTSAPSSPTYTPPSPPYPPHMFLTRHDTTRHAHTTRHAQSKGGAVRSAKLKVDLVSPGGQSLVVAVHSHGAADALCHRWRDALAQRAWVPPPAAPSNSSSSSTSSTSSSSSSASTPARPVNFTTSSAGVCTLCVRVVSCRVVSCRVVSCRVVSCRVVSCRVVSCRVCVVLTRVLADGLQRA